MIKILLDPGHAWNGNPYPTQKGYYEGTQMWKLAQYLQPELENRGFYVKNTRPNLKDFHDVADRGKMAKGFDLVVSLHSNAPGSASDTKTTGTVIIYTLETPNIIPLADDMGKRISKLMDHHYRGSIVMESASRKGKNRNSVLRNAMAVGCKAGLLIEHGFHTNPKDAAFLVRDENLKRLAIAEAEAIDNFYKGEINLNYLDNTATLYKGVKNDFVKQLQEDLIAQGYDLGKWGADGSFGTRTKTVLMQWQKDNGLEVDGRFGGASRRKMAEIKSSKKVDDGQIKELQAKVAELEKRITKAKELGKEISEI